jgi:hypothetical protein
MGLARWPRRSRWVLVRDGRIPYAKGLALLQSLIKLFNRYLGLRFAPSGAQGVASDSPPVIVESNLFQQNLFMAS